jgi:5-methyltetrahydrofolate--homocysteine methyltransferase
MRSVMAADVLMGNDADCLNWIKKYREPVAEGEVGARGRRATRRRRPAN